jgi:hypothetical protein
MPDDVGAWEDHLIADVKRLQEENEKLREALQAIATYARRPHTRMGEACGVDACIACLIEGTATEALDG